VGYSHTPLYFFPEENMERKSIYTSNRIQSIVDGLLNQVRVDHADAAMVDWHILIELDGKAKLNMVYRLYGVEREKEFIL
jgi:hypothetical protein